MIKIYSERNSCSNYLKRLIELNLQTEVVKTHALPVYDALFDTIVLTKNPYAWLLSLWKKPHGSFQFREKYIYLQFEEFIRSEWRGYDNAIQRYNEIMLAYKELIENHPDVLLMRSEDLQKNPRQKIAQISFNYDYKAVKFRNIVKEVNSGGNLVGSYNKLNYYLKEEWKEKLTESDISFINRFINDEVFNYFEYEKL